MTNIRYGPAVQNVKFPLCPMLKYHTTLSGVEILQEGVDVEEGSDLFDDDLNLFANNNLSRPTGPTFHPVSMIMFFSYGDAVHVNIGFSWPLKLCRPRPIPSSRC